jgi:UPF0271 protein
LLDVVTSANIACGFHAGDPATIAAIVRAAKSRRVSIGAHPSYPDLDGFGRTSMSLDPADVEMIVLYQIGAIGAIARAHGATLTHVKPHGALYNDAARDRCLADAIASAVRRFKDVALFGLAGSALVDAARAANVKVLREGFCDRVYERDGSLRSRTLPGAVIDDPAAAAKQAVGIATRGETRAADGATVNVAADTLCIHGDTPGALAIARAVRAALEASGVQIIAPA